MENSDFIAVLGEEPSSLRLVGELDVATTPTLQRALENLPLDGTVTLDVSELSFIDSTGLHTIVGYANGLDGAGPVVLRNPSVHLRRIIEVVGLEKHPKLRIV